MTSDAPAARPTGVAAKPAGGTSTFEFEPHNCFACGSLNEHGLRIELHLGQARAWTELTLDRRFEGWAGIAHGGIIATLLDEVMAWSLVAEDNWGVTARMSIDYRQPVPIGVPIRGEGWVVRSRRRIVETAGHLVGSDGTELATAEAVYLAADEARKRELQARYGYRLRGIREPDVAATPDTVADPETTGPAGDGTPGADGERSTGAAGAVRQKTR